MQRTLVRHGLLAAALTCAIALLAAPFAGAVGEATLTLKPTHGQARASFTATYSLRIIPCDGAVTFYWDGELPLGTAPLDASCTATIQTSPPAGLAIRLAGADPLAGSDPLLAVLGDHRVTAQSCTSFACYSDTQTYTIDSPPPPTPKPTPKPAPRPTARPTARPTQQPTPKPIKKPKPTAGPIATVDPASLSPSPVAAGPSAAPSGGVLGAVGTPKPTVAAAGGALPPPAGAGAGDGGGGGGGGSGLGGDGSLPALAAAVPGPEALSTDLDVLGTNLILTVVVLLTFGLTSSLFNSTIKSNREQIDLWTAAGARRLWPVFGLASALSRGASRASNSPLIGRPLQVVIVLGLTGLVYGFLSPDFALDARSAVLFAAIVLGIGFVTYLSEGGGAFVAKRRHKAPASVRLYIAAVAIAIVCVAVSRLMDFQPGILYGFVASNLILSSVVLSRRQSAQVVLVPTLALLTASLLAWLVLLVLRPAAETSGAWWLSLVEVVVVTIFVAGLEGVFYAMIPITFMDGATVLEWSKVGWALMFGTATFLFWHLLLNQNDAYLDALRQTRVVAALGLVLLYGLVTLGTWLFFKAWNRWAEARQAEAGLL
ncbi:MAG: FGLLP motif-containing membrane protein [Candidatus Limnocylindrales bacterium]